MMMIPPLSCHARRYDESAHTADRNPTPGLKHFDPELPHRTRCHEDIAQAGPCRQPRSRRTLFNILNEIQSSPSIPYKAWHHPQDQVLKTARHSCDEKGTSSSIIPMHANRHLREALPWLNPEPTLNPKPHIFKIQGRCKLQN